MFCAGGLFVHHFLMPQRPRFLIKKKQGQLSCLGVFSPEMLAMCAQHSIITGIERTAVVTMLTMQN